MLAAPCVMRETDSFVTVSRLSLLQRHTIIAKPKSAPESKTAQFCCALPSPLRDQVIQDGWRCRLEEVSPAQGRIRQRRRGGENQMGQDTPTGGEMTRPGRCDATSGKSRLDVQWGRHEISQQRRSLRPGVGILTGESAPMAGRCR